MDKAAEQKLADSGAERTYRLAGGTELTVTGAPGFRLLCGDELREAAEAAGLIPKAAPPAE